MKKIYLAPAFLLAVLFFTITACKKKSDDTPAPAIVYKPLATLDLVKYAPTTSTNKRIFMPVTKVGTASITITSLVFDTGSAGMTFDANGTIPASMITDNGITFTGDSVVINGITITSTQGIMSYGDATGTTREYGYLAYAPITIGDANGTATANRVPMFLYYKITDGNGVKYTGGPHANDVFGVGPGVSYASKLILSPLTYFTMPAGVTSGFRITALGTTGFTSTGTYATSSLVLGLIPADLSTASGFIMHPFGTSTYYTYTANIPATITFNGNSIAATVLFDSGTPSVTVIEDKNASSTIGSLAAGTTVTVTTSKGFTYTYVTASTGNLTAVQNPNNTQDTRTVFALDFFQYNEYLTDYTNHQIGLKNN